MTVLKTLAAAALVLGTQAAFAQSIPTSGATVIVPAYGEVTAPNDQAVAMLAIEEQDKDKAAAASRVNQKIKQGLDILKKEDPQAKLKTQGYYTYPVYPEDRPLPPGAAGKPRQPAAWRVGQYVQVTTNNLNALPKTVAAAQKVLTELTVFVATNDFQLRATELVFRDGSRLRNDFTNAVENAALEPALFATALDATWKITEPLKGRQP